MENIEDKSMRSTEKLINELCELILTFEDGLVVNKGIEYIDKLSEDEKAELIKLSKKDRKTIIQENVQALVLIYIQEYEDICETDTSKRGNLFAFDNGSSFDNFRNEFFSFYISQEKNNEGTINFPGIFRDVFNYIEEMSNHFRVFEKFYDIRKNETLEQAKIDAKALVKETIDPHIGEIIDKSVKKAEEKAKAAKKAADDAERAAKKAADDAEGAVNKKMIKVYKSVSETSVTILGIFAGIVLTVFAGLFYSAAVLENISNTNFCILITASALVGFVCFNLLAIMFTYIERFRSDNKEVGKRFPHLFWGVNIALLLIFIVFGIFSYSEKRSSGKNDKNMETSVEDEDITTLSDDATGE